MNVRIFSHSLYFVGLVICNVIAFSGCDSKREILDVETPAGEVEVNEDTDTGEVTVDVDGDDSPNVD